MSDEQADSASFLKAIEFASRKHSMQRRKGANASPYINHPIAVAHLLAAGGNRIGVGAEMMLFSARIGKDVR